MDFLLGIVGDGFVLVAADSSQARSIIIMKENMDKMLQLSKNLVMLSAGPVGDTVAFGEYIHKNLKLQSMRNGFEASSWAAANFVRHQLATSLRSRNAYQVNLLLAGCDETGPQLYYLDYLASMSKVPFGAHGYGAYFALSILDRWYKPKMTLAEAQELMHKCLAEVRKRFVSNFPDFVVRVVDAEGVRAVAV